MRYRKPTVDLVLNVMADADKLNTQLGKTLLQYINKLTAELIKELRILEKNGKIDLESKIDLVNHPEIYITIAEMNTRIHKTFMSFAGLAEVGVSAGLIKTYTDTVSSTYDIFGRMITTPQEKFLLDEGFIKGTVLSLPWCDDGKVYNERLINNLSKSALKFSAALQTGITEGRGIQWISKSWETITGSAAYDIARLLKTETMAMWAQATHASYSNMGIQYVKITNPDPCDGVCLEHIDDQLIPIYRIDLLPPYHPNCMCCFYAADTDNIY